MFYDDIETGRVCSVFEEQWKSGNRPKLEEFLASFPKKRHATLLIELLPLEWKLRVACGQQPTVDEYLSRFPTDPDLVRSALEKSTKDHDASGFSSTRIHSQHLREAWKEQSSQQVHRGPVIDAEEGDPQQIGRYHVIKLLGKGGFGRVYLARDDDLQRSVAIKVPSRTLYSRANYAEQYLAEARTLAGLDHPNIVPIFDIGSTAEHPCFIVSKWIEGTDLSEQLKSRRPSCEEAAKLVATVARALGYAHARKVVHRDIKPANILLDGQGKPFVADFGVALSDQDFGKLSESMVGTPHYMSPEQARGEGHLVDGRSDIFSLGVVFYKLLTGEQTFTGSDRAEVVERITRLDPRPPRQLNAQIPKELERICLKALAKRASDRYATCSDFAEDLEYWLTASSDDERASETHHSVPTVAAATVVSSTVSSEHTPVSMNLGVVPKGLRYFDQHDADFFLSLVPGPRDRDGLPDCIRQWKTWVEEPSREDSSRVGVMYGPSGCGKSSLARAGFLPLLESVEPIIVEAAPQQTEIKLLRQLRHRFEYLSEQLTLSQALSELRRGGPSAGRKPLIVLDQFEQWLQAHPDYEMTELLPALRQCDGLNLQCLILVRDDFFLALSRFMSLLEIPLMQGQNMMLVDLFDPPHARKVLTMFGRAFDRLPAVPTEPTRENAQFIAKSIESLESDGKVFPVRLALFAEMVKSRPWTPATIVGLGGAEGIGTIFLEEAFSASHAPASQRVHEQAARAVLESLLPEPGTELKGRRRTRDELLEVSGYRDNPSVFREFLQMLDFQLRLITPTESADIQSSGKTESTQNYYQLSHDYLVPSVREWISRQQKQTFAGRLQLQLDDRATLFSSMPEKRNLLSWWEWLEFHLFLRKPHRTDHGRQLMRFANRHFAVRTIIVTAILLVTVFGLYRAGRATQARSLSSQLLTAQTSQISGIVQQLLPYRSYVDESLSKLCETTEDRREKLAASLALVNWDPGVVDDLCDQALECEPDEMALVRDALAPHGGDIEQRFWSILETEEEPPPRRFRAAQMLVKIAPPDDERKQRWESQADFVEQALVESTIAQPQHFATLVDLMRPAREVLIDRLGSAVGVEEQSAQSASRINLLAQLLADAPERLAKFVPDTEYWQFELMREELGDLQSKVFLSTLRDAIQQIPADESTTDRERTALRVATSAALLAGQGYHSEIRYLLHRDPHPTTRSYLIHRFREFEVPTDIMVQMIIRSESDPGILAGLLMALGEYEKPSGDVQEVLLSKVVKIYQDHPDAGVHSAAEWVLRKWQEDQPIKELLSARDKSSGNWRVNSQGFTMVRIDGSSDPRIGRDFEIATMEVTREQFAKFQIGKHFNPETSPTPDCPVGIITWFEAAAYCGWLSEQENLDSFYPESLAEGWSADAEYLNRVDGYRLPTETEWELACRADTTSARYFGESPRLIKEYAWHDANSEFRSWPGGLLKPNDFGLFDMYGNINEWCDDVGRVTTRVIRGGVYFSIGEELTSDFGGEALPTRGYRSDGFRIARTVAE